MKLLRTLGLLGAAAGLALLPACSGQGPNKLKLAFISNNEHEFWKIAQRGTEKAAEEFDVEVEFKMPPGGGTPEAQRRFIEDLLVKGVKGIAISPNDARNQSEFLKEVNEKVPLITQDSDVPDPTARRCYIGTDNVAAGRAAGGLVKKALPDGGKFIIYVGKLDAQNAVERRRGVVSELAGGEDECRKELEQMEKGQYPVQFGKYTLIDTMTDDGKEAVCRQKVDDALIKYSDVNCLVGLWAYNPPAMLEGVRAANKLGKVQLVAFDENEETLQGIKDGHIIGTVVQNPYQFGYQAIEILAHLARGQPRVLSDLEKENKMDNHGRIFVPHRIVTKEGGKAPLYVQVDEFHAQLKKLKGQ
jgi:ribose transport system substrate-binding protein